jgi:hypothetical protein
MSQVHTVTHIPVPLERFGFLMRAQHANLLGRALREGTAH